MVTSELISKLLEKHRLFRDIDLGIRPEELHALVDQRHAGCDIPISLACSSIATVKLAASHLSATRHLAYVRRLATLHELWPQAKFVHIIRDGRDVCLSMRQKRAERSKAGQAGTLRHDRGRSHDHDGSVVGMGRAPGTRGWRRNLGPQRYHEMRYEAFVADPEAACRGLCDFLGVPYDGKMLEHHRAKASADARLYQKHSRLERPITAGLRDWRQEMPPADAERFEASAGRLLDELGYPRTTVPGSAIVQTGRTDAGVVSRAPASAVLESCNQMSEATSGFFKRALPYLAAHSIRDRANFLPEVSHGCLAPPPAPLRRPESGRPFGRLTGGGR